MPLRLISIALLFGSLPARGYIDITPTLGRVIAESHWIAVVQVEKVHREKRAILYSKITDLKGELPFQTIRHQLAAGHPPRLPRELLDWARPGERAVLFVSPRIALLCTGQTWYQTDVPAPQQDEQWWRMSLDRPELALAYRGSVRRLADAVTQILAGREVIITTVAHGAQGRGTFSDVVFNTLQSSAAEAPMQRLRASLRMPPYLIAIGADPSWFVGLGAVTHEDLPRLIEELSSPDRAQRLDAADDLLLLRQDAREAIEPLQQRLVDDDPRVRLHAATALLAIDPKSQPALKTLTDALADPAPDTRRDAANSIARLGPSIDASLPQLLTALERESGPQVRCALIQTIGAAGPTAAPSANALIKLLDDPAARLCAAEALGRIGAPAAIEALPALTRMLASDDPEQQWAAARSMVLIGTEGAKPVVPFLVQRLNRAPRGRELYQLTWLLGILGPIAKDALPDLANARWRDNELATIAMWAIAPCDKFPWQLGYTADRACDLWLFADYIQRMGPARTNPAALALVDAILNDRAGRVPSWGHHLLIARKEVALPALIDALNNAPPKRQIAAKTLARIGGIPLSPGTPGEGWGEGRAP